MARSGCGRWVISNPADLLLAPTNNGQDGPAALRSDNLPDHSQIAWHSPFVCPAEDQGGVHSRSQHPTLLFEGERAHWGGPSRLAGKHLEDSRRRAYPLALSLVSSGWRTRFEARWATWNTWVLASIQLRMTIAAMDF